MTDCRALSASNPFSVCNSGQKRISAYTTFFLHSLWHKSRVACLSCSSFCKNWLQKSKTPQFFPFSARFEFFFRAESFCSWSQLLRLSQGFSTGKSIPCFAASSSINSNHEIKKKSIYCEICTSLFTVIFFILTCFHLTNLFGEETCSFLKQNDWSKFASKKRHKFSLQMSPIWL